MPSQLSTTNKQEKGRSSNTFQGFSSNSDHAHLIIMAAVSQQQQVKKELQEVTTMASTPSTISPADAAKDPLAAVRALHASSSSSQSSPAEDGDWGVTELFRAVAEDEELAKTVRRWKISKSTRLMLDRCISLTLSLSPLSSHFHRSPRSRRATSTRSLSTRSCDTGGWCVGICFDWN